MGSVSQAAIFCWFGYDLPLGERLSAIRRAGFGAAALWWDETFEPWYGTLEEQAALARSMGLSVSNAHLPYHDSSLLCEEGASASAHEERIRRLMRRAVDAGVPVLVLHPFGQTLPVGAQARVLERRLLRLADLALSCGVALSLENLSATAELVSLFEEIPDHPALGLCYDIGHGNVCGGVDRLMLGHPEKLLAVHVHDNDGTRDQHLLPFEGTVDWASRMRLLSGPCSHVPLTLECVAGEDRPPVDAYLMRALAVVETLERMRAEGRVLEDQMEYKVSDLALSPGYTDEQLREAAAASLGVSKKHVEVTRILRQAVDARKRNWVHYVVSCACRVSSGVAVKEDAKEYVPERYDFPYHDVRPPEDPPVVVGTGPAGIFCAYGLALAGLKPIVVERGGTAERRTQMVEHFFSTGHLSHITNVQFGEGGAGTFSDGKLTTGTKDPRQAFVLERYAAEGAPPDILYLAKPHMGTDRIRKVVARMRHDLVDLGCTFAFETQLVGLRVEDGRVCAAVLEGPERMWAQRTSRLVLAPGNGARDTFRMLQTAGVELEAKNFAVGLRIEHLQEAIDMAQYGTRADFNNLPAADYKVTYQASNGRPVYSFCVCPGGEVVGAASEEGGVVTNGMSSYARNGRNCNGALVVGVRAEDFGSPDPLAGIGYQRMLEEAAFNAGGGGFAAPVQRLGDFLVGRPSKGLGSVAPTYRPAVRMANLRDVLPEQISDAIAESIPHFARRIRGFDDPDAVLTGVETRTSSPVRIARSPETYESVSMKGLFPCGEGAGYAGGIMSAATDGLRCAEKVCESLL